jgi:hypothetical protein
MFCPNCEQEFPWHVMVCPTCDVETVDRLPGAEPTPEVELVTVLTTYDEGVSTLAKSLLEAEHIDYFVKGQGFQDRWATGFSFATGPAEFVVRADDAERARTILSDLIPPDGPLHSPRDE